MTDKQRLIFRRVAAVLVIIALGGCGLGSEQEDQRAHHKGPIAVLISVEGEIPQFSNPASFLSAQHQSQYKLARLLEKAASDLNVQEIVVHLAPSSLSLARASELVETIKGVAATGKPLVCHVDTADNVTYWLAAQACPKILLSPAGSIEALGLSLEAVYFKQLLASLGIAADMVSIGKYKDGAEPLTRDAMSPEARESSESLLFELHRLFLDGIAAGRKLEPARVQEIIDNGPYDAKKAAELGLVDGVSTLGTHIATLSSRYSGGVDVEYGKVRPKPFALTDILKIIGKEDEETKAPAAARIAVVPLIGPVVSGRSQDIFGGAEMIRDREVVTTLTEIAMDDSIRAVVLRVDSPGGSPLASDNIWHAIKSLKAVKPVIASLGGVAASGGYYIASAATEIMAQPTAITGSIGVFGGKIVLKEAATKVGVNIERIKTGRLASLDSPFSPFDEAERKAITERMQKIYDLFIDRVAEGRSLDRAKVTELAEGRVWTGSQALKSGLVNRSGTLAEAIRRAGELAGLPPGTPVDILPKPKSLMDMIGEALGESDMESATRLLARRHQALARGLSLVSLLLEENVLTHIPFSINIR